jgi:hypothetical protein
MSITEASSKLNSTQEAMSSNQNENSGLLLLMAVDIVVDFWVGYYGEESRCLVRASAESQSLYMSTLTSMRAIADYMC